MSPCQSNKWLIILIVYNEVCVQLLLSLRAHIWQSNGIKAELRLQPQTIPQARTLSQPLRLLKVTLAARKVSLFYTGWLAG